MPRKIPIKYLSKAKRQAWRDEFKTDLEAIWYLQSKFFTYKCEKTRGKKREVWVRSIPNASRALTPKELRAICYLHYEHNYGWWR